MRSKDRELLQKAPTDGSDVAYYYCSHCRWRIMVSDSGTTTEVDKVFEGHNSGEHIVTAVRLQVEKK